MENRNQNRPIQQNKNQNPNQFRRPFNPRCFPRDRRNNEDQKIQPHFHNNLVQNDECNEIDELEVEDLDPNIEQLDDMPCSNFLTRYEYQYAKVSDYHEKDDFEYVSHIPDIFHAIPHKTFGLILK